MWIALYFTARAVPLEVHGLSAATRIGVAIAPVPAFAWFLREFLIRLGEHGRARAPHPARSVRGRVPADTAARDDARPLSDRHLL